MVDFNITIDRFNAVATFQMVGPAEWVNYLQLCVIKQNWISLGAGRYTNTSAGVLYAHIYHLQNFDH
ncbi:hypothetical protein MSG28_004732 [Choristoneura fumiferana]|uniref:Uncharacterized protein n=1 Tax=Choristoneura fumiferana TaxID=7141 RepID=A0ACC0K7A5_CHOFU|nr:hypothetical protein MSG28_004732 [Choristoneura fumiferana]